MKTYIIWVDEAGRGAWAGPVVAWAFCVWVDFDFSCFPWLTDSKKLTPKDRDRLYELISHAAPEDVVFAVGIQDAMVIDRVGIREANRLAMQDALTHILEKISQSEIIEIQIDGRDNYRFDSIAREKVRYIVRGDLTEPVISAASILAKVTRDRMMCDFSLKYSGYDFHLHKGYGTSKHQNALLTYGITSLHRKSYAPIKRLISHDS